MRALERLVGLRVVADPAAIDAARWRGDEVTVLRFAPDDAFALGASGVEVDDPLAIVEHEVGFAGARLSSTEFAEIMAHVEWPLPAGRPALAQGAIAGVPAKLWLANDGEAMLLANLAYAEELEGRLR